MALWRDSSGGRHRIRRDEREIDQLWLDSSEKFPRTKLSSTTGVSTIFTSRRRTAVPSMAPDGAVRMLLAVSHSSPARRSAANLMVSSARPQLYRT